MPQQNYQFVAVLTLLAIAIFGFGYITGVDQTSSKCVEIQKELR